MYTAVCPHGFQQVQISKPPLLVLLFYIILKYSLAFYLTPFTVLPLHINLPSIEGAAAFDLKKKGGNTV